MKRFVVALVLALGAGLSAVPASAVPSVALPAADVPDPGAVRIVGADVGEYPDVAVSVVAPSGLADGPTLPDTFALTENGIPREVVVAQQPGSEQDIVLALDVSGGMSGGALEDVKRAAADFVQQAPAGAHIGIVTISTRPQVVSELTTDAPELLRRISELAAGGNSAIADSAATAVEVLGRGAGSNRMLVLMTDGSDTSSELGMTDVPGILESAGVALYVVQMATPETNSAVLQQIVGESSGQYVTAGDTAGLSAIYGSVARSLGNLYVVRYRSEAGGDTRVVVSVTSGGAQRISEPFRVTLPAATPPVPQTAAAQGFWATGAGLGLGLVALYAAFAALVFTVIAGAAPRISAERRGRDGGDDSLLHRFTEQLVHRIDQRLSRRGRIAAQTQRLREAGLKLRPGDFITLVGAGAVTAAAIGFVLSGPVPALLLAVVVVLCSNAVVSVLTSRRRAAFADQLDDSVQLLASNLRAGHSLLRALDAVSREAEVPTSEEFARVVNETRVGRDLGQSLHDLAQRMQSEDFEWIAQAISIHREVGGDLAEVMDQVGNTIRERNQIRRQVKALAAEGKLSAYVLMALPFGIAGFLLVSNPTYLEPFTEGIVGYSLIGVCVVLLTVGGLWLRKLVDLKF